MSKLPRVVLFEGIEVYAARCDRCWSDAHTTWVRLPALDDLNDASKLISVRLGEHIKACCSYCKRGVYPDRTEAVSAREPERLNARLAELRAEAR